MMTQWWQKHPWGFGHHYSSICFVIANDLFTSRIFPPTQKERCFHDGMYIYIYMYVYVHIIHIYIYILYYIIYIYISILYILYIIYIIYIYIIYILYIIYIIYYIYYIYYIYIIYIIYYIYIYIIYCILYIYMYWCCIDDVLPMVSSCSIFLGVAWPSNVAKELLHSVVTKVLGWLAMQL